jgi:hypothetical protein
MLLSQKISPGGGARMAKTLATQRSLKHLRKLGWQCAIVEKWLPARGNMKFGIRQDVWKFGDILACRAGSPQDPEPEIALIQTFPLARWKDHWEKLLAIPELKYWQECGGLVFMHGWAFKPKDGIRGAKKVWTLREEQL